MILFNREERNKFDRIEEEWRPCPEYEEYYEISNFGRVKSKAVFIRHDGNWAEENGYVKKIKVKNITTNRYGYLTSKLCKLGKCRRLTIHRLVAKAFIPNPNNYTQVNHIDGNKENNCIWNLEWVSQARNIQHAFETGLMTNEHLKGSNHHNAKLNEDIVKTIRKQKEQGASAKELCEKYNIGKTTLRDIITFKTWRNV
jgi:hypothetical protein